MVPESTLVYKGIWIGTIHESCTRNSGSSVIIMNKVKPYVIPHEGPASTSGSSGTSSWSLWSLISSLSATSRSVEELKKLSESLNWESVDVFLILMSVYNSIDWHRAAATIRHVSLKVSLGVDATFFSSLVVSLGISPREDTTKTRKVTLQLNWLEHTSTSFLYLFNFSLRQMVKVNSLSSPGCDLLLYCFTAKSSLPTKSRHAEQMVALQSLKMSLANNRSLVLLACNICIVQKVPTSLLRASNSWCLEQMWALKEFTLFTM